MTQLEQAVVPELCVYWRESGCLCYACGGRGGWAACEKGKSHITYTAEPSYTHCRWAHDWERWEALHMDWVALHFRTDLHAHSIVLGYIPSVFFL